MKCFLHFLLWNVFTANAWSMININQKLSRQFVMINWIEYYDYKYYLTEGVFNVQHSFISLSRMSFQPSKNDVSWLVRKAVWALCYVIWLVIGPIIKKIGDWWMIEFMIFDKWFESLFPWLCNTLLLTELFLLGYSFRGNSHVQCYANSGFQGRDDVRKD